ncbi:HAMP domain-containing sensor histidine kinase [Paenibacillus sp. GSMTC-2017]|uniref:HAMP domain-containing sensor histidine kinase n=1 Tax=Paenibacillus sp. GSMTC-2017 TaxID=2794350 RepID=UPI001E50BF4D|nr:HAMP domain-containing sensor histidine kinase [Paenibacillus sp. GSMTC-2017]
MSRYMFIILLSFLFLPIVIPIAAVIFFGTETFFNEKPWEKLKYGSSLDVVTVWQAEAATLGGSSAKEVEKKLIELKQKYVEATVFWVNADGKLGMQIPVQESLPKQWSHADAIRFMKKHIDSDPFTVVSFLGQNNGGDGFMVLQIPRSIVQPPSGVGSGTPFFVIFIFMLFALLALMSLVFFQRIRKRLLRLQEAMTIHDEQNIPISVSIKRMDEIGALEEAFNGMIEQLKASRALQLEEEELRKQLIASLSHDLRTPLTVMGGHIYALREEPLSGRGFRSLEMLEEKTTGLSELIDNLLTYTLMTSGRYKLKPEQQDILRLTRESAAAWFPIWEKEEIEVNIQLPDEEKVIWFVDKEAFHRILDNLFQNILRHASDGRYIGILLDHKEGKQMLVIEDRGNGFGARKESTMFLNKKESFTGAISPSGKGAGIGLAIVDYLVAEMGLAWKVDCSVKGTRIYIYPNGE